METEKLTKQTITVFSEIIKLISPTYKFNNGGANKRIIENFLNLLEKQFGAITCERLVDALISCIYIYREREKWTLRQILGPTVFKKTLEHKHGVQFYQDKWLASGGLSRDGLVNLIKSRKEHPLHKFIYVPSEELTKKRQLNTNAGFILCQLSTLGWSPLSNACSLCNFMNECKIKTEEKYPEIYRLRTEYGNTTE